MAPGFVFLLAALADEEEDVEPTHADEVSVEDLLLAGFAADVLLVALDVSAGREALHFSSIDITLDLDAG